MSSKVTPFKVDVHAHVIPKFYAELLVSAGVSHFLLIKPGAVRMA
jgi:hypothetical protein